MQNHIESSIRIAVWILHRNWFKFDNWFQCSLQSPNYPVKVVVVYILKKKNFLKVKGTKMVILIGCWKSLFFHSLHAFTKEVTQVSRTVFFKNIVTVGWSLGSKVHSLGSVQKRQATGFKQKQKGRSLMHPETILPTDRIWRLKGKVFVVLVIFSCFLLLKQSRAE